MRFTPAFLEDLKSRVSIYDYAGRRLAWDKGKSRPSAGDYWAPCPFHAEKTASFHVRDRTGGYKCFGCGVTGDVFGLCMQLEGVSFPEAVETLAQFAGVPLPEADPFAAKVADARQRLFAVMERAAAHYRARLIGREGQAARAYLLKRGLPEDVWKAFGIGFAPEGWSAAFEALTAAGCSRQDLYDAGLAKDGSRGPIDIFRNRILFPIADGQGRIIAFGGRAMDPNDPAKYLNSPQTPLFDKGKNLYRLQEARRRLAQTKGSGLVIAEGYVDVIAFERAGVPAVAPLGTALTEEQLTLAWRAGPEPVLCFDGDGAGQRAAGKALDLALPHLSPDKTVRFAVLPKGLDPDDLFQKEGPEALARLIDTAMPAAAFLLARERDAAPLTTPEARAGLKRRLRTACGRINDPDTKALYLKEMLAGADELVRESSRPARPPRPAASGGPAASRGRRGGGFEPPLRPTEQLKAVVGRTLRTPLEDALRLAAERPHLLARGADALAMVPIADPELKAIRKALLDLWSADREVDRTALSLHLAKREETRAVARVLQWPPPIAPKRPRSRELAPLEEAAPPASQMDSARPAEADPSAIEAEWMALLEHYTAMPAIDEDIDAIKTAAVGGDDDSFARAVALLKARHSAEARGLSPDPEPTLEDEPIFDGADDPDPPIEDAA